MKTGIELIAEERARQMVVTPDSEWREVAEKLAAALQGTIKRHRIALASALGEDEPVFDPPAPSIGDNLRNTSDALAAFEKMKVCNLP